jgi:hypothetical protein
LEVILQHSIQTQDEDLTFSINDPLLWEIIQMIIRGETIAFASHRKGEGTFTFFFIIFCQAVKKGFVLSKNS